MTNYPILIYINDRRRNFVDLLTFLPTQKNNIKNFFPVETVESGHSFENETSEQKIFIKNYKIDSKCVMEGKKFYQKIPTHINI